mmetsp:Transcript_846/g.1400  ORF Transcript_846/g.1400 Transcript_846/m.1400 type:complete len:465 (+) Transcript_846:47-1441(+)
MGKRKQATFEVEEVVGKRGRGPSLEYLVKWVGYNESQNTWEPSDHLTSCNDVIEAFEAARKPKKPAEAPKAAKALATAPKPKVAAPTAAPAATSARPPSPAPKATRATPAAKSASARSVPKPSSRKRTPVLQLPRVTTRAAAAPRVKRPSTVKLEAIADAAEASKKKLAAMTKAVKLAPVAVAAAPKRKADSPAAPAQKKNRTVPIDLITLTKLMNAALTGKPPPPDVLAVASKAASAAGEGARHNSIKAVAKVPNDEIRKNGGHKVDGEISQVDAIIGMRFSRKGGIEYKIQWSAKGEISWEPEDNVMDDDLVEQFENSQQREVYGSQQIEAGDMIEVKNIDDGFQNSWSSARVIKKQKTKFQVEYADFTDENGCKLQETLDRSRLRLAPPKAAKGWAPKQAEIIEVLEDDCWWEARVQELKGRKVQVMFRVSDEVKDVTVGKSTRPCNWLDIAAAPSKPQRR